jgi:hypothetical protein
MGDFLRQGWWILAAFVGSLLPLVHTLSTRNFASSLRALDRRWIFLLMFWSVLLPIYYVGVTGQTFPEVPGLLAQATFDEIDRLAPGDPVLMAFDYDPPSAGELQPMATAFVRHAAEKQLRMYFMALWPLGAQMIDDTIGRVLKQDFPELQYGRDYVNLGFKSGGEAVIKVVVTNLRELYTTDVLGTGVQDIPMMQGITNVQQMKLVVNVSAGTPGTKEWVQYATTPYPALRMVVGVTGVGAPQYYPYIPRQIRGLLGAIKGAAEYEQLVLNRYDGAAPNPKYTEGLRRMGPQLVAHLLVIFLIVVANILYFTDPTRARP